VLPTLAAGIDISRLRPIASTSPAGFDILARSGGTGGLLAAVSTLLES
jgi:hypothetical protein